FFFFFFFFSSRRRHTRFSRDWSSDVCSSDLAMRNMLRSGLANIQAQFLETTFAVMGALSKADSVVTREEIRAAEALFDRLHLSPAQREAAKAAFNRGKAPDFDLDGQVDRFARAARGRIFLLQL